MLIFKLKDILKEKKTTLTKMSEDIGISRQALSSIANNSSTMVQLNTLQKISSYLNVPISDLLVDEPDTCTISIRVSTKVTTIEKHGVFLEGHIQIKDDFNTISSPIKLELNTISNNIACFDISLDNDNSEVRKNILNMTAPKMSETSPENHQHFVEGLLELCIKYTKKSGNAAFLDNILYVFTIPSLFTELSYNFTNANATWTSNSKNVDPNGFILVNPLSLPNDYFEDSIIYSIE